MKYCGPLSLIPAITLLLTASCGRHYVSADGPAVNQQRQTADFRAVSISAPISATITVDPGAATSVRISAPEEALRYIISETDADGTLQIRLSEEIDLETDAPMKATIIVPVLHALRLAGSQDVSVKGTVSGHDFETSTSGSGDIVVENVVAPRLKSSIAGSGSITIHNGTVEEAEFEISGSGEVDALRCRAANVAVSISGSGDAAVYAAGRLKASIAGSGDVEYAGDPAVEQHIAGSGSVSRTR